MLQKNGCEAYRSWKIGDWQYMFIKERETVHGLERRTLNVRARQNPLLTKKASKRMPSLLERERETGLEPATPTLARSCSTN